MLNKILEEIIKNKNGVEIGGPSKTGEVLYKNANIIDNIIFSKNTIWSNHETSEYRYYENKIGKVIINDAVNISNINDNQYDFVFSSHTLEHIANPLKALKEWLRITKNDGYIIIIVPEKSCCFDHRRNYSKFETLPEILRNHDLRLDPLAGNFEQFTKRSLDNFNNRCLHHYVYSDLLLLEICKYFNCEYIYNETQGLDRWFIMKKL